MKKHHITLLIILVGMVLAATAFLTKAHDSETKKHHPTKTENATKPTSEKEKSSTSEKDKTPSPQKQASGTSGRIIDASTKKPIEGALVTVGEEVVHTSAEGKFHIRGKADTLKLRAPGYARLEVPISKLNDAHPDIALTPFRVKALYLTVYGTASSKIREATLQALKRNKMNALVIDVKGDRGFIPFKVDIPLADKVGAQDVILIKDMPALIASLKEQGLYLIARIVTFKDDKLAAGMPQYAVKKNGAVFRDREKLRWVDPFRREVWDYNIDIAKAAAKLGFDEIQFDYVRCPDTKGIVFSQPSNMKTRTETITGFLEAAYKALRPYNVMVAADIFGYVPWNTDDTGIGQQIEHAMNAVDIVSLMLYPSGFHLGIPNYRNPVQHSYEIVNLTLKKAQERTSVSPLRFRPWLQAFRDYAFHGGDFAEARMRLQIKASNDFGSSGYMFWNPRNVYPNGVFDN